MKYFTLAVTALFILTSCQKELITSDESINAEMVSDNLGGPGEFPTCKLRRYVHEHGGVSGLLVNGLFTYNSAGNPISITYGDQTGTGNQNHYFYYDKKNRLREWRKAYAPEDRMESIMHRYGYDDNDVLVVDTLFRFAEFDESGFLGYSDTTVSQITYDSQGRVVKETIRNLQDQTTRNPTYTYDSRGNLGIIGWRSSWYDTKVSYLRSHPVFQFLMRNYSRNNPWNLNSQAQRYNSKGLPLSIEQPNDVFFNAFKIDKLIYDCQ